MYLQTSQNICPENQTSTFSKIIVFLFEISYFIFYVWSYFCYRIATLPKTPKKEGKENYFPKPKKKNKKIKCWQEKCLQYLFLRFSMLSCGRNLCNLYQ